MDIYTGQRTVIPVWIFAGSQAPAWEPYPSSSSFSKHHSNREAGASQRRFPNGSLGTRLNQPNDGGMPDQSVAGRLAPNRGVGRESLPNRKRCLQSQTIGSGAPNRSFQELRSHPSNRKRAFNRPLPIANGRFNRDPSRRDLSAKDCRPTTRYTGQGARKKSHPAVPFLDSPAFMLRIRKVVQRKSYSRGSLQSSAT